MRCSRHTHHISISNILNIPYLNTSRAWTKKKISIQRNLPTMDFIPICSKTKSSIGLMNGTSVIHRIIKRVTCCHMAAITTHKIGTKMKAKLKIISLI